MSKFRNFVVCLALAGCAAESGTPDGLNVDELSLDGADKSGETTISARPYGHAQLLTIRGELAASIWDVLEAAGYRVATRRGVQIVSGRYVACVTDLSAAACQLVTRAYSEQSASHRLSIQGVRFASAASELFGATAAAMGIAPSDATETEYGDIACWKDARYAFCGLGTKDEGVMLELSLQGMGNLGPDYVYEGWLITAEGPVTSGRFQLTSDDEEIAFPIDQSLAEASSMFVLTIEPAVGDDPAPADTHVLAGAFDSDGIAPLTIGHGAALGSDFSEAAGAYILQTPSSPEPNDYDQGVWFVNPAEGAPSLALPSLPMGWAYEGWVVVDGTPISTGTFREPSGADSDGGGPTAGPTGTPPFPGQDFIEPPMVLTGGAVVISVEPVPDNGAEPFFLKPLVDMSADDVGPGVLQDMGNMAMQTAPSGSAALR